MPRLARLDASGVLHHVIIRRNERNKIFRDSVADKVASIFEIEPDEIFRQGRQKTRVKARSLFCYWAAHEMKISLSAPARKLDMTAAGIGYAVRRGEAISIGGNYQLID